MLHMLVTMVTLKVILNQWMKKSQKHHLARPQMKAEDHWIGALLLLVQRKLLEANGEKTNLNTSDTHQDQSKRLKTNLWYVVASILILMEQRFKGEGNEMALKFKISYFKVILLMSVVLWKITQRCQKAYQTSWKWKHSLEDGTSN